MGFNTNPQSQVFRRRRLRGCRMVWDVQVRRGTQNGPFKLKLTKIARTLRVFETRRSRGGLQGEPKVLQIRNMPDRKTYTHSRIFRTTMELLMPNQPLGVLPVGWGVHNLKLAEGMQLTLAIEDHQRLH